MSNTKHGWPAFPYEHYHLLQDEHGITMRDYFAAKAMQVFCEGLRTDGVSTPDIVAGAAYQVADAMLKAREE